MIELGVITDVVFLSNSKSRLFLKLIHKTIKEPKVMFRKLNLYNVRKLFYYLRTESVEEVSKRMTEYIRDTTIISPDLDIFPLERTLRENIEAYDKLTFPIFDNASVSIIIPVYNQFQYTYNCLKSILKNSEGVSYEIIIADDCSEDYTKEIEKNVLNITIIHNKENLRFLKNCNNAAKLAKGKYILFLNNDTQVQQDWLLPLVDLIERDENIGMVGSKLVYNDGRLQEAGGIIWKDALACNYGRLSCSDNPEFNYVKEVDYISGASIMIKKELWQSIGGFDERYTPAYYEDSDLAFEVRSHGYKVMYQPKSVVVHFEGISNGIDTEKGQKSYQLKNQKEFLKKWKVVLENEHSVFVNGKDIFEARDRSKDKKTILVIDHYVPQYDKDAGSRTVFLYLKLLSSLGYNVKFLGDNFHRNLPYTEKLEQLGIEVLYGSYYAQNWEKWIKSNCNSIDIVFMNRPHISEKYIDFLKKETKAKIVYYGHDLHFLREEREYEIKKDKSILASAAEWKKKELNIMKKADVVYYPSKIEIKRVLQENSKINAKVLLPYFYEDVIYYSYDIKQRKDIMFVGGFNHRPNVDGVLWFYNDVFPIVLKERPDIKVYILGSNPPKEIMNIENKNFVVRGFVSDEELSGFYRNCRLDVVPLRYGAGIKGKVIEAMSYSMPVITTSIGVEGIKGAEDILVVKDTAEDFAKAIISLYDDENALASMAINSCNYIQQHFSSKQAENIIKQDF